MSVPSFYWLPSNQGYGIFLSDAEFSWEADTPEGKVYPIPRDIVAVLDSVKTVFEDYFGKDYVNSFQVSVFPHTGVPVTYRDQHVVFLSARGRNWCQYMYQFAHELCHVMIGSDVIDHFRWFEESICELASLFFLNIISNVWDTNPPYPNWKDFAPNIGIYVNKREKDAQTIPSQSNFSLFFAEKLEYLSKNCLDRKINLLCAINLLPIFKQFPNLWADVPKIAKIKEKMSFLDTFQIWKTLSIQKTAIDKIIALFTTT